ncbi:MAG TPA: C25 family cysteine peptidase, partial [Candidatus Cloacimonadota bacterium]|nr:C25 family cysteine peptidase [Candidatus Cloacimonadota bacterium]
ALPSYYITNPTGTETDVTDHPYTMLAGNDYFPEMIVGRMSVDTANQLQIIVYKILHYEKAPYMGNTAWYEKALLVAGNYADSPPIPTTPVKVTQWLRDKMYDYGYNGITELYYWPPYYNVYPGTAQIVSAINNGVGIVSYRGWGDSHGWHYPQFHTPDLDDLTNGLYLPVMTSIVCNTGDFANSNDPCFGEKWMTLGSGSNPAGGVAFVGPSDLHTSTPLNNALFSGFYAGLLDEDNHSFGSDVLRGKWELYDNFPLIRQSGENVEFYFHVYNILCDPSLDVWTKVPEAIEVTLPDEISVGTNYLEISAPDLDGAVVTAIKENEVFCVDEITDGAATLYFNMQTAGDLTITITKPNHHPFIETIDVQSQSVDVGLEEVTSEPIVAGENVTLYISLHNFGTEVAAAVSATLSTNGSYIDIENPTVSYGDIYGGYSVSRDFEIQVLPGCPDNSVIEFTLANTTGSSAKFELVVNSLDFEVTNVTVSDENGYLDPGETCDLEIEVTNSGTFDVTNLQLDLVALTTEVTVVQGSAGLTGLTMNSAATVTYAVELHGNCPIGKNLQFRIDLTDDNSQTASVYFNLEAGEIDYKAPTGPDGYGYYAYDSYDKIYTESPVYEWIELDPAEGGSGTVEEMGDDTSRSIGLPFDFQYYGEVTDSITVCSNGWLSMQTTWETYFRNWNIPSALGPYGGIYPFWDDFKGELLSENTFAPMRICHYYDAANHTFTVEWNECYNRQDYTTVEKVEVILYDPAYYPTTTGDGEIQFNYYDVGNVDTDDNYATIGIENFEQNDGVLLSFAGLYPDSFIMPVSGTSVKFTTDIPAYIDLIIPNPDFSVDIDNGMYPLTVQFTNETDYMFPVNSYFWDFGDGETSDEIDPSHVFLNAGTFDVTLTVTNTAGTNSLTLADLIEVVPPTAAVASFTADVWGGLSPVTINFTNTSEPSNRVNTYLWNFGDGDTSTEIDPVHVYDSLGVYTITLVASNPIGTDTLIVEDCIKIFDQSITIWPGDTDNNGSVEEADILPIGVYWRERGEARENASSAWEAQTYPLDWDSDLAPFADCNGDGEVDIADVLAIIINWDQIHEDATSSSFDPGNLSVYRENFRQIYHSLGNSSREVTLKNYLAAEFGFTTIPPVIANVLNQNYPNPFNPTTSISFEIAEANNVELEIYNVKGQLVKTLVKEEKPAGVYTLEWSGQDNHGRRVASGLYFYRLRCADKIVDTKKMLLLK